MKMIFVIMMMVSLVAVATDNSILLGNKPRTITVPYDLVAYTLVSETGHPSKVLTLGIFPSDETCLDAAKLVWIAVSTAQKHVGLFCIEKSVTK